VRVLFWGTPAFSLPALQALGEEGHDLVGVVTQPDRPAGRGRGVTMSAVKEEAIKEMIPVLQPERARGEEFLAQIRALEPDLSVVVAYGQILKPEVLDLPRFGSVNIHGSLLPELRGAAPVQWSIIRGHEVTGVTIMRMEAGLDSGPMLLRVEEPIGPEQTGSELAARLAEIGAEALVEALALLEDGQLVEEVQDHSKATYAWSPLGERGPVKLFRPRVEIGGGEPGAVIDVDAEGVLIACGDGAVRVREVQPPGKRRMSAAEWVRGRGVVVGDRFGPGA
jgi:methionyl-tRNA formyltransferase